MSEPQVTHIERADHVEHADLTAQAGTVSNAQHVESVENLDLHIDSVGSDKVRKLTLVRDVALLVVALAAIVALAVVVLGSNSQSEQNAKLIRQLRAELEVSAQDVKDDVAQVEAEREAEADRVECVTRFTYAIQLAQGEQLSAQSALTVIIGQVEPGADRVATAADAFRRIATAQKSYDMTVQQRIDYDIAGTPLPCPLPPGLNER